MKLIELVIEENDIESLKKACGYLGCRVVEYKDSVATIEYHFNYELFRLGSIYGTLKY